MTKGRKVDRKKLQQWLEKLIQRVIAADKSGITILDDQGLAVHVVWVSQILDAASLTWNDLKAACSYNEFREIGRRRLLTDCNDMLETYEDYNSGQRELGRDEYITGISDKIILARSIQIPEDEVQAIIARPHNLQPVS